MLEARAIVVTLLGEHTVVGPMLIEFVDEKVMRYPITIRFDLPRTGTRRDELGTCVDQQASGLGGQSTSQRVIGVRRSRGINIRTLTAVAGPHALSARAS
jgi:hypothetical protein